MVDYRRKELVKLGLYLCDLLETGKCKVSGGTLLHYM